MSLMPSPRAGLSGLPPAAAARFAAIHTDDASDELDDPPARESAAADRHLSEGCPADAGPADPPRPGKTLVMQCALEHIRPLLRLNPEEMEAFLLESRMYPSLSRFALGSVEFFVPRRDITVGLAMRTLRERLQRAAVIAELVCRLQDDDEGAMDSDDEAVIAAAAIRDDLREAMGMLGVYELAVRDGVPVVQYFEPVPDTVA